MSQIITSDPDTRGRFITFEGGEGVGKSTQARNLCQHLKKLGIDVVETREPGGTAFAEHLRTIVLDQETSPKTAMSEALVMFAARKDHVATVIEPALSQGSWVLCDRFTDSTRVYQGVLQGLGISVINDLDRVSLNGFEPDCTLLFDSDPQISLQRVKQRAEAVSKYDAMALEKHAQIRSAFQTIAAEAPSRVLTIDAAQAEEAVFNDMLSALATLPWFRAIG